MISEILKDTNYKIESDGIGRWNVTDTSFYKQKREIKDPNDIVGDDIVEWGLLKKRTGTVINVTHRGFTVQDHNGKIHRVDKHNGHLKCWRISDENSTEILCGDTVEWEKNEKIYRGIVVLRSDRSYRVKDITHNGKEAFHEKRIEKFKVKKVTS